MALLMILQGTPVIKKIPVCLILAFSAIITLYSSTVATAQKKEPKAEKEPAADTQQIPQERLDSLLKTMKENEEIASKLKFQNGEIKLKDGLATLKVPTNFRYLDPHQTDTVLVKLWGNPPSQEKTLGMIFPAEISPASPESWGVVITYLNPPKNTPSIAAGLDGDEFGIVGVSPTINLCHSQHSSLKLKFAGSGRKSAG